MRIRNLTWMTMFVLFAASFPLHAQSSDRCAQMDALKNQKQDVDTIQRLEYAWSVAYTKGDVEFEKCLLGSDYTEIKRTGAVGHLSDELALAAKNKDKNLPMPDPSHKSTVLLHGDVAVAYGGGDFPGPDGKVISMRNADFYVWENGQWHVFFAQQTQKPS